MEYLALNDGTKIAQLGLGTFLLQPQEAEKSVISAIENGYVMIDTANAYMNEKAVGRGIKLSSKKREELYISTKLWPSVYSKADEAIDDTLRRLDTDYIDLLFLHQPVGDYIGAYKAIERAVEAGKVKSIGLSNFDDASIEKMDKILEIAKIKPAFLQVEAHPYYPQTKLREKLNMYGIKIMAWYPLGHGDSGLFKEPVIDNLVKKYNKSAAQIILRWHTQIGNVVIPGSKNEQHIKENIRIFDFELTEEEIGSISNLDKNTRYYIFTEEQLQNYLAFAPDFDSQIQ